MWRKNVKHMELRLKKWLSFWLFLPLHGWEGDGLVLSFKTLYFECMGLDTFGVRNVFISGRHLGQEYPRKLCAVGWAVGVGEDRRGEGPREGRGVSAGMLFSREARCPVSQQRLAVGPSWSDVKEWSQAAGAGWGDGWAPWGHRKDADMRLSLLLAVLCLRNQLDEQGFDENQTIFPCYIFTLWNYSLQVQLLWFVIT